MLKLSHDTLTDRAYAALKTALTAGDFPPGHVLVIRTVAEAYGISATPVREALQRLVAERLLSLQSNRSIIVPHLEPERFTELCRIRCVLEGLAGEMASERTNAEHIEVLRGISAEIVGAINKRAIQDYVHLNQSFHFTLYERAASPLLLDMIQDLWCKVGPFFTRLFDDGAYACHANDQHLRIIEALRARDAAAVRMAVVADISAAASTLRPLLVKTRLTAPE